MKILEYLKPENQVALGIIIVSIALFVVWFSLLIVSLLLHRRYRREIENCEDVSDLIETGTVVSDSITSSSSFGDEDVFRSFQQVRRLDERSPITQHLHSIFEAGRNESQLDVRSLVKNTSDQLLRSNGLQRSLLSIFIILGLLGTLFGLADTLASLDSLLQGAARLNNDILGLSLQRLLGTLKSAFAPSIWGVTLTVVGVLLQALYVRAIVLPLVGSLERITLTVWVPQLIPTTSQKLLTKLQLTERQMQRSFAAAQQVATFADGIKDKTGDFVQTLSTANATLADMTRVSNNLYSFSLNFIEGVKVLVPFQQDLRNLYQQVAEESRAFHQSVQNNIAESNAFRSDIQQQLKTQHERLTQLLGSLKSYESAYVMSREGIDEKLGVVLVEAQKAFGSLSLRNEEIGAALDEGLGKPLRESLTENLGGIKTELQVQLGVLSERMARLDAPLNQAAQNFGDTFYNFNDTTRSLMERLQLEFAKQNDTNLKQLDRLETLSEAVPGLLQTLSDSSKDFSGSSSSFAAHLQRLSTDVTALSQNIHNLTGSVDSLKEQVTLKSLVTHLNSTEQRIGELVGQQTRTLQQLGRAIETLSAVTARRPSPFSSDGGARQSTVTPPEPSLFQKVRSFIRGR